MNVRPIKSNRGFAKAAVLVLLGAIGAGLACRPDVPRERANVLLVVIDTLRADRLSCAGYPRATTPALDALAARGVRFDAATAPRGKTTPSMASLFTGLYPHDHGVRDLTRPLGPRPTTLAESFRDAGYTTAAIIGNYVLRASLSGLQRGFGHWDEDLPDRDGVPPDDVPQRRATSLVDVASRLLDGLQDPWFVYLHAMDPHGAYDAPAAHRVFTSAARDLVPDPTRPAPRGRRPWIALYNVLPEEQHGEQVDAAAVRDRYDAEVRYIDAELGRLFAKLAESGRDRNTWIIVTADHGESLGEHHYWFEHGRNAYEPSLHVPLIVVPPASWAGARGVVRHTPLSLADLAPTIAEWTRVNHTQRVAPRGPAGRSRAALLAEESPQLHAVFAEKVERADLVGALQTKAVRLGPWKLLRSYARADDGLRLVGEELYDLARDPGETQDLADAPPAAAPLVALRRQLLDFVAADTALAELGEALARERAELEQRDPEAARRLRALGY